MEITKEMLKQHPLHEEYLEKIKNLVKIGAITRFSYLAVSLLGIFLIPAGNAGDTLITLLKTCFKFFDEGRFAFDILLLTIFPFFIVFPNLVRLIQLLTCKPDYVPEWYGNSKLQAPICSAISAIILIVSIFTLNGITEKTLGYDLSVWIAICLLMGITNFVLISLSNIIARKFVIKAITDFDLEHKIYNDKEISKLIKKTNAKKSFSKKLGLLGDTASSAVCAILVLLLIYPLFSPLQFYFGVNYSIPEKLGQPASSSGIYLTDEQIKDGYYNKSITVEFYSNNYEFYKLRIDSIEEEIIEKQREFYVSSYSPSEKEIKKFEEEIKELKNKIDIFNYTLKKIEYKKITAKLEYYENGPNTFGFRVVEMFYNTNVNTSNKKEIKKISLDKTNFYANITNFNSEKITATIEYKDGSKSISYISPDNAYELNQANRGTHKLKWSDSWGNYECSITLS